MLALALILSSVAVKPLGGAAPETFYLIFEDDGGIQQESSDFFELELQE